MKRVNCDCIRRNSNAFNRLNSVSISYTYDNLGRTKTVTHAGGRTLTYAYTGDGQLYSVTETKPNSDPVVYLYQYDTLGRLMSSEKRVNGASVLRSYQSFNDCNQIVLSGWQISENTFSQTYTYNAEDGSIATVTLPNGTTLTYTYDSLRRVSSIHNGIFNQTYTYEAGDAANQTTPRLTKIGYPSLKSAMNYTYSYDDSGNIVSMAFGSRTNTYVYDINGQLVRENNDRDQYTRTWTYDEAGNITSRSTYAYTTAANPGTATETVTYGYTDTNWRDLLTQYDGYDIYYDTSGNPVQIKDGDTVVATYTWAEGRQLVSMTENGATITYTYDANGMRTGRTYTKGSTTNTYQYFYSGDKLVRLIRNSVTVDFSYNGSTPATMTFNGNTYYYLTNVQGDIIGLTDSTGKIVMGYLYEAYGYPSALNEDPSLSATILYLNPFMYRGYVFDLETKLYYLQSRYYDPEMGRFINADSFASTGQGILGFNMFAYCRNNPIIYIDFSGNVPTRIDLTDQDRDGDGVPDEPGGGAGGSTGQTDPVAPAPNPNGRAGGYAHQSTITNTKQILEEKGYNNISTETHIKTPSGEKPSRYADITATKDGISYAFQVGKVTASGIPVARERRALADILSSGRYYVVFIQYN